MKSRCEFASGPVLLALLLLPAPVFADESAPGTEFTYTDEWAVVSAPPPPGPYRAVNIDPRVPGVDAVPPLTLDAAAPAADNLIPAEAMANAPAAGIPAIRQPTDTPASALDAQRTAQPEIPDALNVSHHQHLVITILHPRVIRRSHVLLLLLRHRRRLIPATGINQATAIMVPRHIVRDNNRYRHLPCMIPG